MLNLQSQMSDGIMASLGLTAFMAGKVETHQTIIKALIEMGWVPITSERQPYIHNFDFKTELRAAGFYIAPSANFKFGDTHYAVVTRRYKAEMRATDKPEDLFQPRSEDFKAIVAWMRNECAWNFVFSVGASRVAVFGYLPPTCSVYARGATVNV